MMGSIFEEASDWKNSSADLAAPIRDLSLLNEGMVFNFSNPSPEFAIKAFLFCSMALISFLIMASTIYASCLKDLKKMR